MFCVPPGRPEHMHSSPWGVAVYLVNVADQTFMPFLRIFFHVKKSKRKVPLENVKV